MIYTASQTPTETVLVAKVAAWRALVALRPMPRDDSVLYKAQPGELMSQRDWRNTAQAINGAIKGREESEVVRIRFSGDVAAAVVEMARKE